MTKNSSKKEEMAEDYCFVCKDGGHLRVCDFKNCLKAYHPQCVGKDPSFLEADDRWTCGWHSCFCCPKNSVFQCYCCPYSVCEECIKDFQFVQIKNKTKGFCNECLKLVILIEENVDVDSDGGKVDFNDAETYEFLFKDYWAIVKDQEGLSLIDVHAASALLKRGKKHDHGCDPDWPPDMDVPECDSMKSYYDEEISFLKDLKDMPCKRRKTMKRCMSKKKKTYIGWGSKELITFLTSIGKDTKEALTQLDACIIIKEYIRANNLHDPDKKKKVVICDDRLHSVFRRKKLKYHKIFSLLKNHFAENDDSDDFSFSSEEDDDSSKITKKQRKNSDVKTCKSPDDDSEKMPILPKSSYASLVAQNIHALYLRRSLVMNLLKDSDSFQSKVNGCFVRVKNDPNELYYLPQKMYQLGQVTGFKKASQTYKSGEVSTDVLLCVSNMWKDIPISMLSDEDFEEEECKDLRELVKRGTLKRPTIKEMEEKIRSIHVDITNHWIEREIKKLQKLIDRANEKGWRKELFQYIEKRNLLCTSDERSILLQKIPEVIADTCEIEMDSKNEASCFENTLLVGSEGNEAASIENTVVVGSEGNEALVTSNKAVSIDETTFGTYGDAIINSEDTAQEFKDGDATIVDSSCQKNEDVDAAIVDSSCQNNEETAPLGLSELNLATEVVEIEDNETLNSKTASAIPIIVLDDHDDKVWNYLDPQGNEQGPFNLTSLVMWRGKGFFPDDFKVWRTGQSKEDGMLLLDVLMENDG